MDQQHPTENGNDTLPELPDQGQRDGSYEEAKNEGTADQSSLEDAPDDGTTAGSGQSSSDASVDGADDEGGTVASGQAGTYSDKGTDAVDTSVPVQD